MYVEAWEGPNDRLLNLLGQWNSFASLSAHLLIAGAYDDSDRKEERMSRNTALAPPEIEKRILVVRSLKVMIDTHLAELYDVTPKRLNEQVRRNIKRFPDDFMFQLTHAEYAALRSHFATLEAGRGRHRKYLPYAFTEQGVAMLSSILNSARAIQVNIAIMRAFVRLREIIASHKELDKRLADLELLVDSHDKRIGSLFDAIRLLLAPEEKALETHRF
jgi:hypothetical protein